MNHQLSFLNSCRTIDLIGFGVFAAVGVQFLKSFPERCYKSALMQVLLEDKRAGKDNLVKNILRYVL